MNKPARCLLAGMLVGTVILASQTAAADDRADAEALLARFGTDRGIAMLVGSFDAGTTVELAKASQLTLYVQSNNAAHAQTVRRAADEAGLLGTRIYVAAGSPERLHLGDDLVDAIAIADDAAGVPQAELLRVLHPQGKALIGDRELVKPTPSGVDDWTHPYHGGDNNPQTTDTVARAPYLTHFLAEPWYGPMPEVTVVSAGRMFKAFGHIALKEREWPLANTLVALNAYSGSKLWEQKLRPGFMVHRNTMIATPEALYVADDTSLRILDPATGALRDEIIPPPQTVAGPVWKWMALEDGVLYALLGEPELPAAVILGERTQAGWPWNGLGPEYALPNYPWGFGRTMLAIDPKSHEILWSRTEELPLDSRAFCIKGRRLFYYSHRNFLACLDTGTGEDLWRTNDPAVMEAIGEHDPAQNPLLGFSSSAYAKCSDDALYFAGPQRTRLVAVSAESGKLMWQYAATGNFQLVLRDDALYAMGREDTSKKFDLLTGAVLADLDCYRGNCTRATGTIDSIFSRGHHHGGTLRLELDGDEARRIALMRPACQDGVVVSGGLLYWGPWMCDCNLSLVGIISLGSAGDFDFKATAREAERLETTEHDGSGLAPFVLDAADWPAYRADNVRSGASLATTPAGVSRAWQIGPESSSPAAAPIAAGGLVFASGLDGAVRAADAATGEAKWTAYTGGPIRYPPAVDEGRVFAGSCDGWVYCFEAATGRALWRFRVAPVERIMPVYGSLSSTWPVAGGVVVDDGVVYAAAGITSYDGTHVVALDAATGRIRWQNNTSGELGDEAGAGGEESIGGVSVQGHLLLHGDRLYFAGGNVVSPAVFDIHTGECLNTLAEEWDQKSPRGRELFLVGDEVRVFDQLLYSPREYQVGRYFANAFSQVQSGEALVRARPGQVVRLAPESTEEKPIGQWASSDFGEIAALAVTKNAVLVAGKRKLEENQAPSYAIAALRLDTGRTMWSETLPVAPVSWGLAVDRDGRTLVALADGHTICLAADASGAGR